jgi:hypothetical protein
VTAKETCNFRHDDFQYPSVVSTSKHELPTIPSRTLRTTMKKSASKTLISILLLLSLLLSPARAEENPLSPYYDYLKQKYDDLPDNGKLATGAIAGFGVSRVAIKSAVTVVKFAGAAFVATEAMNAAGILDDIPYPDSFSDERENLKRRALAVANNFRNGVHRQVNPERLRLLMKTDRMATLGFCSGAFVGFLV